jgi:hypothetical protein
MGPHSPALAATTNGRSLLAGTPGSPALAPLPRRDAASRAHLEQLGERARPLVLARDRSIELIGGLADLVPGATLARDAVVRVVGSGAGSTAVAFELVAAVTGVGEWAGAVDLDGTLGALAAAEAGVALERFAVVRRVPPTRWATVMAALLDGMSLVLTDVPRGVAPADARRLTARARERGCVLVLHERPASSFVHGAGYGWPAPASLTLTASSEGWAGIDDAGYLTGRALRVRVEGRGAAARPITGELARAV